MCKHETTHRKYKYVIFQFPFFFSYLLVVNSTFSFVRQDTSINNLLSFLKSRGHSAAIVDDDGSLEANGLKTPKQQYTRRSRLLHLPSQGANGGSRKIARTSSNIMHSSTTDGQATQTLHSKTQFIVFAVRSFSKNILSSEFVSFKLRDTMSASEFLKYLTWTHGLQSTSETIDCCSAHDSDIQIFIPDSSSTSYWKLINEATFGQLACWCRENRLERKVVVGHAKMDTFGTT